MNPSQNKTNNSKVFMKNIYKNSRDSLYCLRIEINVGFFWMKIHSIIHNYQKTILRSNKYATIKVSWVLYSSYNHEKFLELMILIKYFYLLICTMRIASSKNFWF